MRRLFLVFSTIAVSVLLGACNRNNAQAGANSSAATTGNLPIANFTDEQLVERWNRLATTMSLEKMLLHDCKPVAAPPEKTVTSCYSAPRSVVYIVRNNGKVAQVQFTTLMGIFSVSLAESSKLMARFLHDGTNGDDISLINRFQNEASRNKRFCITSEATQAQMCYLTNGRSYGVEIR